MAVTLDEAIAAETILSRVDGDAGRLILRGRDLDEVAGSATVEQLAALLWGAHAPDLSDPANLARALGEARRRAWAMVPSLLAEVGDRSCADGLRLGLALLPSDDDPESAAVRVSGAVPVLLAALLQRGEGRAPQPPDPEAPHAADFLRMAVGSAGSNATAALATYLVTVADHGMNASTFVARAIASTGAGLSAAVLGAYCALQGPLHGGAPGPVLDMLDRIEAAGGADAAEHWIDATLARGDRLMGFGHRIYRTRDPRADVLKRALRRLPRNGVGRIAMAERVESAARAALARHHPERRLDTNVELYTALLLEAVGLPRAAFTPTFAVGRVFGWTAHILEQRATGRLVRPRSRYVGPLPEGVAALAAAG